MKRESYFHQLTNDVIRKEKEPFTDFGQRIYDMTNTVFMGYSNIDELAIRYFIKSLHDRELASRLDGIYETNSKFHHILEKAVRIIEGKRIEKRNFGDNINSNNRTIGGRAYDKKPRENYNSDSNKEQNQTARQSAR